MQCLDLHKWMSLRLDGRLPAEQERLFQEHLEACSDCSLEWKQWQDIDGLFAGAAMLQPPEDLAARVMARIPRRRQHTGLRRVLPVMLFGYVALVLVLGLPLLVGGYLLGATAAESVDALPAVVKGALEVLEIAWTVGDAVRLFLWAVLSSRTVMAAMAYTGLAGATVALWFRLVVLRRVAWGARSRSTV